MRTGDPIEDYPEYMHDAIKTLCKGNVFEKLIGVYKLAIGIVVFPIIALIRAIS